MAIEESTVNQNYDLPNAENLLAEDVERLRSALQKIDEDVANLQAQIALRAATLSPALTGEPTAPTPDAGDNSSRIATTAFVSTEIETNALTVSGAQIASNKTLLTNNKFADVADQTKKLSINVSGFTTGMERTLTLPDEDVSLDSLPAKFAFRRGNILGTVSQSAGVPTGAIIQTGTSGATRYTKFADGTMIVTGVCTLSFGNLTHLDGTFSFPATFVDTNYRVAATLRPPNNTDSATTVGTGSGAVTSRMLCPPHVGNYATTSLIVTVWTIAGASDDFASGDHLYADVHVIGRWF